MSAAPEELAPLAGPSASTKKPIKVLHVEVGGSYGGSLRALELYLRYSDRNHFIHDLLFYYGTPGMERMNGLARTATVLYDTPIKLASSSEKSAMRPWSWFKNSSVGCELMNLRDYCRLWLASGTVRRIADLLHQEKYSLVHSNNTFTYQDTTLVAAKRAKIPVVAHIRNPVLNRRYTRSLMRMTTCIVSDSRFHEKALASWGMDVPLTTCYNAVEVPVPDLASSRQLRQSFLNGGTVLIGSLGRLDDQKAYGDLIKAAKIVIDSCPEARFVVAGEGPLLPVLRKMIDDYNLRGEFILCGFRNDVADFITALDVFASSSRWEGLPLAVVEAMLLGKPVVATDVGGNSEIVGSGGKAKLAPPGRPDALAKELLSTIRDYSTALKGATEAREQVEQMFNPATSARRFDYIIASMLANPARALKLC